MTLNLVNRTFHLDSTYATYNDSENVFTFDLSELLVQYKIHEISLASAELPMSQRCVESNNNNLNINNGFDLTSKNILEVNIRINSSDTIIKTILPQMKNNISSYSIVNNSATAQVKVTCVDSCCLFAENSPYSYILDLYTKYIEDPFVLISSSFGEISIKDHSISRDATDNKSFFIDIPVRNSQQEDIIEAKTIILNSSGNTVTNENFIRFQDDGGTGNYLQNNSTRTIIFDAGSSNVWDMYIESFTFDGNSGALNDNLKLEISTDGVSYSNASIVGFHTNTSGSGTTGHYFPFSMTFATTIGLNQYVATSSLARFLKFTFVTNTGTFNNGWSLRLSTQKLEPRKNGLLYCKKIPNYNAMASILQESINIGTADDKKLKITFDAVHAAFMVSLLIPPENITTLQFTGNSTMRDLLNLPVRKDVRRRDPNVVGNRSMNYDSTLNIPEGDYTTLFRNTSNDDFGYMFYNRANSLFVQGQRTSTDDSADNLVVSDANGRLYVIPISPGRYSNNSLSFIIQSRLNRIVSAPGLNFIVTYNTTKQCFIFNATINGIKPYYFGLEFERSPDIALRLGFDPVNLRGRHYYQSHQVLNREHPNALYRINTYNQTNQSIFHAIPIPNVLADVYRFNNQVFLRCYQEESPTTVHNFSHGLKVGDVVQVSNLHGGTTEVLKNFAAFAVSLIQLQSITKANAESGSYFGSATYSPKLPAAVTMYETLDNNPISATININMSNGTTTTGNSIDFSQSNVNGTPANESIAHTFDAGSGNTWIVHVADLNLVSGSTLQIFTSSNNATYTRMDLPGMYATLDSTSVTSMNIDTSSRTGSIFPETLDVARQRGFVQIFAVNARYVRFTHNSVNAGSRFNMLLESSAVVATSYTDVNAAANTIIMENDYLTRKLSDIDSKYTNIEYQHHAFNIAGIQVSSANPQAEANFAIANHDYLRWGESVIRNNISWKNLNTPHKAQFVAVNARAIEILIKNNIFPSLNNIATTCATITSLTDNNPVNRLTSNQVHYIIQATVKWYAFNKCDGNFDNYATNVTDINSFEDTLMNSEYIRTLDRIGLSDSTVSPTFGVDYNSIDSKPYMVRCTVKSISNLSSTSAEDFLYSFEVDCLDTFNLQTGSKVSVNLCPDEYHNVHFESKNSINPQILGFTKKVYQDGQDGCMNENASIDMMRTPFISDSNTSLKHVKTAYIILSPHDTATLNPNNRQDLFINENGLISTKHIFAKIQFYPDIRMDRTLPQKLSFSNLHPLSNIAVRFLNTDLSPYRHHNDAWSMSLNLLCEEK